MEALEAALWEIFQILLFYSLFDFRCDIATFGKQAVVY